MLKMYKGFCLSILILVFHFFSFGTITQSANPPMVGCPDTLTTTLNGTIYQWNFGPYSLDPVVQDTNTASAIAYFYQAGTYTVYVNVINGGTLQLDSLTITVQPGTGGITLSTTADTVCEGTEVTYTVNQTGYVRYDFFIDDSLVVSTPADNFTTATLVPGDSVRVIGFNGTCFTNPGPALYPVVFPVPPPATLTSSVPSDTICGGDTITFTANPSGYDAYSFYTGGSEQQSGPSNIWTTNGLEQGSEVTVIVSKNGCSSAASVPVKVFVKTTPLVITSVPSSTICAGDTVTISATPPGLYNYNFFINTALVQSGTTDSFTCGSLITGDTIIVNGSLNGCTSQYSYPIIMTVHPVPVVTLSSSSPNDTICSGTPLTFTASPSGYNIYQFYNNDSTAQSTPATTYTDTSVANGTTVYVVAINLSCVSNPSDTISITVNTTPVVIVGSNQSACLNAPPDTLTGFTPTGGVWTGSTGITNDSLGAFNPDSAGVGNHILTYTYTNPANGCPGSDSIIFTVKPIPIVTVTPDSTSICPNQSVQLHATSNVMTSFTWIPATGLNNPDTSSPVASPAQTTFYAVLVPDTNGCADTTPAEIVVKPSPVASFTDSSFCLGTPVIFNNTTTPDSGVSYLWFFGDGANSTEVNPVYQYLTADSFKVILIAQLALCADTDTMPVVVYPTPVADFQGFPLVGYNDSYSPITFSDQSSNTTNWYWSFGDGDSSTNPSPVYTYAQPGVYTITLIASNADGCSDTLVKTDYVYIYQAPQVYIPNIFAPGATDAANSIFLVRATEVKVFDLNIFNRVGEKVFESEDINEGWDGTYKSHPAPAGVYAYYLKIVFEDATVRYYKGSVTLLR